MCTLFKKNKKLSLFLKNVSPSKKVTLGKHYIIKATLSEFTFSVKKIFFFGYKNKRSKYEVEKVATLATLLNKW